MIDHKQFLSHLKNRGFKSASGVPCSYFSSLLEEMNHDLEIDYVPAANEADAVAISCGTSLSGKKSAVFMQNSGLGNAVNPLTSLAIPYKIPLLLFISWRGEFSINDPPHHTLMGEMTCPLLEIMGIPWMCLDNVEEGFKILQQAEKLLFEKKGPVAIIIRKNTFERNTCFNESRSFDCEEVLSCLTRHLSFRDLILSTTGFTSRKLHAIHDTPQNFYMMGSMGCVSSIGLGLAIANPQRRVIVIDGDGALLMHAGALATIGSIKPRNLLHILLNNQCYESTGGQKNASSAVNFTMLAQSMGYPLVKSIESLKQLEEILVDDTRALTFIEIMTHTNCSNFPARIEFKPSFIADRFSENLKKERQT